MPDALDGAAPAPALRRRVRQAGALVAVLVLLASLAGGLALHRVAVQTAVLADRVAPSRLAAARLLQAYLDEDIGVRGRQVAGEVLREPYDRGAASAAEQLADLRRLLAGRTAALAQVDRVEEAAAAWQAAYALPALAGDRPDAAAGGQRFQQLRAEVGRLEAQLTALRDDTRERLRSALHALVALLVLGLVALVVVFVAVWRGLQRLVLRPVEALAAETRAVVRGDLERPVTATGPRELRDLGGDVEAMRRRVVQEYVGALDAQAQLQQSERRLVEQAADLQRSNTELEQFAYVASHDLQEPLRKVASFCQLLERRYAGQLDERADQYIAFAVDGAKRMQQLINDLLAFSRVGRSGVALTPVDLEAVLDRALLDLSGALEEAGGQVTHDRLPEVRGDAGLLGQVLVNVVGNALKFRSDAPPRVHLGAERTGDGWLLSCTDNGIGIEPQYADKVFVIFQRLHPKEAYAGTGIGLALCKKVVEHHGGRMWVDPGHTGGTRVCWTLPALDPAVPEPAGAPATAIGAP